MNAADDDAVDDMNGDGGIKAVAEGDDKNEQEQTDAADDDVTRTLMKQAGGRQPHDW